MLPWPATAAEQPEIIVELQRERIYEGESVVYRVTLNHVENPPAPELKGFDDFEVASLGEQSLDSRQVFIVNGRRTEIVRRGRQYDYRLTPRRAGELTIPGPVAKIDGRVLTGRTLTLRVAAPDDQDVVVMQIIADRQSVYPTQPFTVTLSIAVKELPGELADRDPLSVLPKPPALEIPWANDERFAEGLKPQVAWRRWLSPLENNRGIGFSINNLGGGSVFSLFEKRLFAFHPRPRRVERPDKTGSQAGYWQYDFSRTFTAGLVGRYSFGPVTTKGTFAAGVDPQRGLVGESFYAVARPLEITVKDVPEQGRPEAYIGAVGQFRLDAQLAPTNAKVGDPMTLTLTLSGKGTLETARAPQLERIAPVAEGFKIYEATEQSGGDWRRFTYSLRPLRAGIEEFPSVPAAYFDVEADRYVTLRTEPIAVRVSEAQRLSDRQIVSSPQAGAAKRNNLEVSREGIFANVTDPAAVRDDSVRPGRWLAGIASAAGLYALVAVVAVRLRRLSGNQSRLRRRGAVAKARRRLRGGLTELEKHHVAEGADQVQAALVGLVADVADLPEAGLTPRDVSRRLADFGLDDELLRRAGSLLETCDAARYGVSGTAADELGREASRVFDDLVKAMKAERLFR